jgi:hypothetical protein
LARHDRTREQMTRELAARYKTPRERLSGVFDVQGLSFYRARVPWVRFRERQRRGARGKQRRGSR